MIGRLVENSDEPTKLELAEDYVDNHADFVSDEDGYIQMMDKLSEVLVSIEPYGDGMWMR